MNALLIPLLMTFSVAANSGAAARPKLAVLPTTLEASAAEMPRLVDEYVLSAVHDLGLFEVVGQDDINALLGFEQQKELAGCEESSCIAAIGGALGVAKLLSVKIAKVGKDWAVTIKLINIEGNPKVEARGAEFFSGDAGGLLKALGGFVANVIAKAGYPVKAEAKGAVAPEPPKKAEPPAVVTPPPANPPPVNPPPANPPPANPPPKPEPGRWWHITLLVQPGYSFVSSGPSTTHGFALYLGGGFEMALSIVRVEPHLRLASQYALGSALGITNHTFSGRVAVGGRVALALAGLLLPFIEADLDLKLFSFGSTSGETAVGVTVNQTSTGGPEAYFMAQGGVDVRLGRYVRLGAGVGFRTYPRTVALLINPRLTIVL